MNHKMRPSMEVLESKALLSHVAGAVGVIEHHGHAAGILAGPIRIRPAVPAGVELNLTTNQAAYMLGSTVQMTLTVTDVSHHSVTLFTGPSIDGFVVSNNGTVVWRSNSGVEPLYIVRRILRPGQSFSMSAQWTPTTIGTFVVHNQMSAASTSTFAVVENTLPVPAPTPPGSVSGGGGQTGAPIAGGGGQTQPGPISPPVTVPSQPIVVDPISPIEPIIIKPGPGDRHGRLEQK